MHFAPLCTRTVFSLPNSPIYPTKHSSLEVLKSCAPCLKPLTNTSNATASIPRILILLTILRVRLTVLFQVLQPLQATHHPTNPSSPIQSDILRALIPRNPGAFSHHPRHAAASSKLISPTTTHIIPQGAKRPKSSQRAQAASIYLHPKPLPPGFGRSVLSFHTIEV